MILDILQVNGFWGFECIFLSSLQFCISSLKGKSSFWCLLDIVPIKNEKSQVVLFLASHKDITANKTIRVTNNTLTVPGIEVESDSDSELDCHENTGMTLGVNLGPDAPSNYNYGRRRSRAVLYQLSGHYTTNNNAKGSKLHSKLGGPSVSLY